MKIYTRKGDAGQTSLFGGETVPKNSDRVRAYGAIDELNSAIGVAAATENLDQDILAWLHGIQADLFVLGSWLSSPKACRNILEGKDPWTGEPTATLAVNLQSIENLETKIDTWEQKLEPLKTFILPGGSIAGANIHMARAICRRAEREAVHLKEQGNEMPALVFQYLNRLGDALFVCARFVNSLDQIPEKAWKGR